ncbi:BolA family transcriptional regulator [Erythrobacter sp. SCSIO 43205]|uniref:BolA family protein n=1 Tax=Erythrobacter sp. SCSIO 43205 TaxID=2779361 RepID=UPI001CA98922|nr:BolA family protein [Erythrobacter sp. SCSIO 43205]UAB79486.1 BolA family transcriptional regulator [Erythrobacter sp. SCSIO 43205]
MSGNVASEMENLLTKAFAPTHLEIINDSAHHSGHSGDDGSGESHFTVVIEAAEFAGMTRLARQRAVIAALGDIVGDRVHAVAIKASAPAA